MLNVTNINFCQNISFKGSNSRNVSTNIVRSIDAFGDKMLETEKAVTGYITPEVRMAIANKVNHLKLKAQNINPQNEAELIKPLQDAINGQYDITETYLALGDFERKLSDI